VAQHLTYDLNFDALSQHQAGRRVSKFVRMPITETGSPTYQLKLSIQVARVNGRANLGSEDESRFGPGTGQTHPFGFLSNFVLEECHEHGICQIHCSSTFRGFRVRRDQAGAFSLELSSDTKNSSVAVEVLPHESERLAAA
jgi:hypothetical protein